MDINQHDTALVVTDLQNYVLSAKGVAWACVRRSVQSHTTPAPLSGSWTGMSTTTSSPTSSPISLSILTGLT
jgi:hypothetical protein